MTDSIVQSVVMSGIVVNWFIAYHLASDIVLAFRYFFFSLIPYFMVFYWIWIKLNEGEQ